MNDIIISLSDAIATLVAVVLAFLLSILSDRASWKHRKKEQIRDHQIEALKHLTSLMQNVEIALRYIVEQKKDVLASAERSLSEGIKRSKVEEGNANLNEKFLLLQEQKGRIEQEYLELKLLRYNPDQLSVIKDYCAELEKLIERFQNMKSPVTDNGINDQCIEHITKLFASFIEVAENGLTK